MKFDYLVVGAGLFGAVFAHEASLSGKKCLVLDKRSHIGGNIYTDSIEDITVHEYGAHIFHTSNKRVWDYMCQFCEFNHFVNSPIAVYQDKVYNLPFNMNTYYQLWGIRDPSEAREKIASQVAELNIGEPKNLEEQALKLVGPDIYERLIKGYTEKQWGRDCQDLPPFIIKRLPLRFTFDNNYFSDPYQGIPIGGYTPIIERLLENSEVLLNTDYFDFRKANPDAAAKTVYTGMLDEYFGYEYGRLAYRSLRFEHEVVDSQNVQGNAVVNYTERSVPFTRIIEHKHFEFGKQLKSVITREYPAEWQSGMVPYYPVNDETNNALYQRYSLIGAREKNVIFGGRLAGYRYYDMDKTIESALGVAAKELSRA